MLAQFLEQATGDSATLGPPLVNVGLVGVEDASAAGPLAGQELVRARRVGETADGVAGQPELPADRAQPNSLVKEGMDSCVMLTDAIGQAAGRARPWW
ncbi:hypothetical protein [Streptomyces sp. AC550_RSS872]|uniref:hypothetical protein n=1 Tax=Streptomyces sp. AC550_RSS872 TaxID=2823689 RepID=UPI001C252A08|nr:hypothetical protein [Streptomyces sp. AC550_RSS872]